MKRRLVAHGNTYWGRTGLPRIVTEVGVDRFESTYVKYSRPNGTTGVCYMPAFQSWACGFYRTKPEEATDVRPK
jgi:hypothetical protein